MKVAWICPNCESSNTKSALQKVEYNSFEVISKCEDCGMTGDFETLLSRNAIWKLRRSISGDLSDRRTYAIDYQIW